MKIIKLGEEGILKPLKFCHVTGGEHNFDYHAWLSNVTIENLRYAGCKVKIIKL
jgi:hypothetical protein